MSQSSMGEPVFETVVERHHGEIHRFLRRMTARASDADDLAQETFVRAWRAYSTLQPDANVRAWLFTIATNLARNYFRTEKRRQNAHARVRRARRDLDPETPEAETLFNEARTVLEAVVAGLPPKQRLAFLLRKVHNLDYDAIAASLQCSADSARAHVFLALRKVRQGLNGHVGGRQDEER